MTPRDAQTSLGELAALFLRLGATSFGGPAAHVAMMRDEVVARRAWLSDEEFLDLISAANLIPGPNSTEVAIHVGRARRGLPGLVVAGACFILPAMAMTAACGWMYLRWGRVPVGRAVLDGVKPVVIGIVTQALWSLAPKAAGTTFLRALGLACALCVALGANELAVLLGAGAVASLRARGATSLHQLAPLAPTAAGAAGAKASALGLFGVFAKIGSVLYGSGYVLVAFLRAELVRERGWLTEAQLLDAVAVGQVTPGPVFTTATFVGWVLAGPRGALAATCGIFLPAFVFVAMSAPLLPRLRASARAGAFLDGVNVASLALMAVAGAQLARAAVTDATTALLAVGGALALVRWRVNATWLVLAGALAGIARG